MCGFTWGGVATAFAVTCLVAAGVAGATVVTASKSTSVPQQTNGSVAARCARGSEAVSGGFANPASIPPVPGRRSPPSARSEKGADLAGVGTQFRRWSGGR